MAKLPRVTAKVFASNAPENEIGQYGSALAGTKILTSDIATIQSLPAFTQGWSGAVVQNQNFPTMQEMNGLQKVFSQQIAYLFEQGIPEYDANTTYYIGSIVKTYSGTSLNLYVSIVDNNLGNNLTDSSFWSLYTFYKKNEIVNMPFPDYSQGVAKIANTQYVAEVNGWFRASLVASNSGTVIASTHKITVNSIDVAYIAVPLISDAAIITKNIFIVPVPKGATYSSDGTDLIFFPCKGGV